MGALVNGGHNGKRLYNKQLQNNIIEANIGFSDYNFPVKLAYTMAINKVRGQTFQYCGVNFRESCFSHGQLHVACSGVGSPRRWFIYISNNKTTNVVYKQVL
ncbi:unnamed protein product [Euphydryas editha]|uniref:Uncharacterized protein n=1 Tax=Euphydryas editha TaxID=104508 RepID=A0AAU9TZU3_EUPED|nr:unnamed protein product [Euphydryas editha]